MPRKDKVAKIEKCVAGPGRGLPGRLQLQTLYQAHCSRWEETLLALYRDIRGLLERHGCNATIKYRVKTFENYYEKLNRAERRGENGDIQPISDLLGLRIICPFLEDIEAVEKLLADHFAVIDVEHKGAQHSFREFGYDSVHLLMRIDPKQARIHLPATRNVCEIQLRTTLQDAWAEVEHELVYKSPLALPKESIKRKLAALNAILSLSDLMFQEIRDFQKEVRKRDQQRRTALGLSAEMADMLCMPSSLAHEEHALPVDLSGSAGGPVEKIMLAALDAHSRGELEAAVKLYRQLLDMKLVPKIRALVYNHRGMARFVLGDYRRALQDFSQSLRFDDLNARAYINRGLCYRLLGKIERSLQDYEEAVSLAPTLLEGYWGRAQTCYEMGLLSRALADCEKALNLRKDFAPARNLAQVIRRSLSM